MPMRLAGLAGSENSSFGGCAAFAAWLCCTEAGTERISLPLETGTMVLEQRELKAQARGPGSDQPETVRVWLLGGFKISVESRTIEPHRWRLRKAAALIKLLALAPGHRLHREQIMAALWPNLDVKSAADNLHRVLHFARSLLGTPSSDAASRHLRLRGDLLELCPGERLQVDVEAFEGATAAARRSKEPAAYRAAIELYAGELLPEDRYEEWTQERREELRRSYLDLLTEIAALHEERGEDIFAFDWDNDEVHYDTSDVLVTPTHCETKRLN